MAELMTAVTVRAAESTANGGAKCGRRCMENLFG
jgi:hypothetical protein